MDKRVVLSVAGSGKTSFIIDSLSIESSALIVTYTDNNLNNITDRVIRKFGCLPSNITIMSYFTFLYSFCYKPLLSVKKELNGLYWETPPPFTRTLAKKNPYKHYLHPSNRVYHNRLAKLLDVQGLNQPICARINKYFEVMYVDEVQDFGGYDFNFLMNLGGYVTNMILVGDFFQHTYDTSRDGNLNKSLYEDFSKYIAKLKAGGFTIDNTTLSKSYRCSPTVCDFVSEKLSVSIGSHQEEDTLVIEVTDVIEINNLAQNSMIVKLFYQGHTNYTLNSLNWGASKGLDDFEDICVVLNATTYNLFKTGRLDELNPKTRNKLYVACTRANRYLYFVEEAKLKVYKK